MQRERKVKGIQKSMSLDTVLEIRCQGKLKNFSELQSFFPRGK
jgi:hypothetical protein